jgi:CP family cyanate transporter-like MFS transporter
LPIGVALIAMNLRPALASVGPVLAGIRHDLGLSSTAAGLLTAVPLVCFGLLSPLAPGLGRRFGLERVLAWVLVVVGAGLLVRVDFGAGWLFAVTIPLAGAIAVANVLVPALIKRDFPRRAGLMMGVYTMALAAAAAAAAGLTAPLSQAFGGDWRAALAVWALLAGVALVVWVPQARRERTGPEPATVSRPAGTDRPGLLRDPIAWQVTAFMGLQSLGFYSVLTWLPSVYQDQGYPADTAGLVLSVSAAVQAPASLVAAAVAARSRDQRRIAVLSCALPALGLLGVLVAPRAGAYLWAVLLGIGQGTAFALALTLVVLRSRSAGTAARLSAMAQSAGYLIAAGGPLLVGLVRDLTGSWPAALGLLLILLVPQTMVALAASRPRYVGDHP